VRLTGLILLFLGLLAAIVGTFTGCGSLFSWNGRHPVKTTDLADGKSSQTFEPEAGQRYTVGVEVVFDREGLEQREGVTQVEAKMPLVVRVSSSGGKLAETTGWLDPNEPPNVLYGHAAKESRAMPELRVERLVGPFGVSSTAPVAVDVDLGPDRVGRARILARRLVVYDDRLPGSIKRAFFVAGLGAILFVAGVVVLVVGIVKKRARNRVGVAGRNVL
jgi:hypothetical protein